jgi:hypothetical protein
MPEKIELQYRCGALGYFVHVGWRRPLIFEVCGQRPLLDCGREAAALALSPETPTAQGNGKIQNRKRQLRDRIPNGWDTPPPSLRARQN